MRKTVCDQCGTEVVSTDESALSSWFSLGKVDEDPEAGEIESEVCSPECAARAFVRLREERLEQAALALLEDADSDD